MIRYKYSQQTVVNPNKTETTNDFPDFGTYDPASFSDGTYDQIIEVTNEYVYGITVRRRLLGWSQNFNDNYIIYDYVFTNNSQVTYDSLYIQTYMNLNNAEYSNGSNPGPQGNETGFEAAKTWQHLPRWTCQRYFENFVNGKVPGKLRVFYEFGADDPDRAGD
jgi:hypothetical protein